MKQRIQGIMIGFLIVFMLFEGGSAMASQGTRDVSAAFRDIKLVVDGAYVQPKDASGNAVEPFIVDGTTYLPVRAVADAVGKAVYWDGPNYTVYLGAMNGTLGYPTLKMSDATNIGQLWMGKTSSLTDNYNNTYTIAEHSREPMSLSDIDKFYFETLLGMKYTKFKGTAYIPLGFSDNGNFNFRIEADGKIIYSSPQMTKTSQPIRIDVDITGCNDFKIISGWQNIMFGDCGFYQ